MIYVDVSKGTYIRSLVNDLGLYLNTYAYMTELDRVKIGDLDISLLNGNGFVAISDNHLFSIPYYEPSIAEINKLKNGISIINNKNIANGDYILKTKQINWGIISVDNEIVKVKKLFGKRINEIGRRSFRWLELKYKTILKLLAFDIDGTLLGTWAVTI